MSIAESYVRTVGAMIVAAIGIIVVRTTPIIETGVVGVVKNPDINRPAFFTEGNILRSRVGVRVKITVHRLLSFADVRQTP